MTSSNIYSMFRPNMLFVLVSVTSVIMISSYTNSQQLFDVMDVPEDITSGPATTHSLGNTFLTSKIAIKPEMSRNVTPELVIEVHSHSLLSEASSHFNSSWNSSTLDNITFSIGDPNKETSRGGLVQWAYLQVIDHRELVVRGLIVVGIICFLLLVFLLIHIIRLRRRRRTKSKVYGLIRSPADRIEMRPLDDDFDDDEDDEDDMTLFDQPNNGMKPMLDKVSPIKFKK